MFVKFIKLCLAFFSIKVNIKCINNFNLIEDALSKPEYNGIVFDGVVMSEEFQRLMKQIHRKTGANTEDAF